MFNVPCGTQAAYAASWLSAPESRLSFAVAIRLRTVYEWHFASAGMPVLRTVIPAASPHMQPHGCLLRKAGFPSQSPFGSALAQISGLIAQLVRAHA